MKLDFEKIKEITTGAVRIIQKDDGEIAFYRFTKAEEELYKKTNESFYMKCFATSGVKLLFKTNSKNLILKIFTSYANSRGYFSFDVLVDGETVGYIDNFSDLKLPEDYVDRAYPREETEKEFHLGDGVKTVCIHFPWSTGSTIREITVDDDAFVEAVKPKNKLLVYGDSITQGYDAFRPSNRYIAKLADALDAEELNKAIGGEKFFPELAELKDNFAPDYVTVAYGTNDWNNIDEETFKINCRAFYKKISENYPDAKIFAITPIWRKDMNEEREFGEFQKVEEDIKNETAEFENVMLISGFRFVPQDEKYYADFRLHPNDDGFKFYFDNLYSKIKKYI